MTQTTVQQRSEMSVDELSNRMVEMRSEWAELAAGDRESEQYKKAHLGFLQEVDDIDLQMTIASRSQVPAAVAQRGPQDNGAIGTGERRSAGQQVVEDEDFSAWTKRSAGKSSFGESPTVELRALIAENDTTGSATLLPVGQPYLVDTRRQRLFIRDLIGVQQTQLSNIPYVRELNSVANALSASTVTEGGTKPEATMQFTPDNAPVEVIATNIPITRQIMEDATTLVGYINGRLVYMLKIREEHEILSGNGIAPDLKGILSYSDVQTQSAVTGDFAVTIGNAIAKIELVDGFADGIAMNPADFWKLVMHRVAGGSSGTTNGVLDAGSVTQSPIQYVWGLPVVRSNSMTAGQCLVGNYGMGATLFDRSQSGVRIFEQHSDFAVKNKVLLLAEERIALAVNRADFFVNTTLA